MNVSYREYTIYSFLPDFLYYNLGYFSLPLDYQYQLLIPFEPLKPLPFIRNFRHWIMRSPSINTEQDNNKPHPLAKMTCLIMMCAHPPR